ncbi:MAG: DUF3943 domain-containing protein [Bacteroides sp.]|nr:DUF3943 domain-containing protein [Bacteroides sp.]
MKNTIRYILTILLLSMPTLLSATVTEDTDTQAGVTKDYGNDTQTGVTENYGNELPVTTDSITALSATLTTVEPDSISIRSIEEITVADGSLDEITYSDFNAYIPEDARLDSVAPLKFKPFVRKTPLESIYAHPYSVTGRRPDWHRLWVNTAVLSGAFIGTLFVLEMLPEDATTWNRAALQKVPLFKRWREHVIEKGPEWDHDKFVFNYLLHPYAGAAYFMAARSNGFNAWQSLLYSACISTIGWEFGIEAFMERPSIQDLFITPIVGSLIGEGFYKLKRKIVSNGYRLAGTPILGNIVAFIIDPVNEVVGLFNGNPARKLPAKKPVHGPQPELTSSLKLFSGNTKIGLSMIYTF